MICSMKGKDFREFVESELIPKLKLKDVTIVDNLNIHKMEGIEEPFAERCGCNIASAGARVESLPPYSPDFNKIEMLWSTIKSMVRLLPTQAIEATVGSTCFEAGRTNFKNWFTKCSYCTS